MDDDRGRRTDDEDGDDDEDDENQQQISLAHQSRAGKGGRGVGGVYSSRRFEDKMRICFPCKS